MTEVVDLPRMDDARRRRVQEQLAQRGMEAVVLLSPANQEYVGVTQPLAEAMRQHGEPVAVIVPAEGAPHAYTSFPDGARLPEGHVHPMLPLDFPAGARALLDAVQDVVPGARRVAVDEHTGALMELLAQQDAVEALDGSEPLALARAIKTPDEVACLRHVTRLNEQVAVDVQQAFVPGVTQNELSALFARRACELGGEGYGLEPVWNAVFSPLAHPKDAASLPFPVRGFDHVFQEGDVMFSDTIVVLHGYHSDFGRTWICSRDPRPTPDQRDCFLRWREIMDGVLSVLGPGVTCGDLNRAAAAVSPQHKLDNLWLGHGIGCGGTVEMPVIGSDLGVEIDDSVVLQPGMVVVLEPVVWRAGTEAAFRSEEQFVITAEGFEKITNYPYAPFGEELA